MHTHTHTHTHKRGDTFAMLLQLPARFPDGMFANWTVTSQLRTVRGQLIDNITAAWADPVPGTARVISLRCTDTREWPVGQAEFDVQLAAPDGFVVSTRTVTVYITRDATRHAYP